ncbi:2-hydroxymuconic semialdehyde hydrolase [Actinomycetales bacterium JB111]|nr:2-hydroxymuconic semialdehyde hydrolase [Actinomycetales bacterium JB111]
MLNTTDYRTPEFFDLTDKWISTGDVEVTHYHEQGTGTPVVFLHGSGTGVSAAANWWLTLPAVSPSMRAIAPDLVGFGATVVPDDAEFGIREWGRHVLRFLDALGIEQAWLVGNSLGGWVALQLAIDHPDRVLGVVSMGTGGAAASAAIRSHADPATDLPSLRRAFEGFVTERSLVADEMVQARQEVAWYEVDSGRLSRVIAARERDRSELPLDEEKLARVDLPVLLVHGKDDHVIPPRRTWRLAETIPGADAVILSRCGHWSQIERADAFAPLVVNYIAGTWRDREGES